MKTIIVLLVMLPCVVFAQHGQHTAGTGQPKGYADSVNKGIIKNDTMKSSPARYAMADVKGNHVHIEYNSPGVKGRIIWGGLVAYGQLWVTGAHKATRVRFAKDVMIAGKKVKAGTYALFTIPERNEWTVILNKNYDQHLADEYAEKDDVVRVKVKAETHSFTPRLTYTIEPGLIRMQWEKLPVSLPFTNL